MKKYRTFPMLAILLFALSLGMLGTETNYVAASSSTSISITPEVTRTLLHSSLNVNLSISEVTDIYLWAVTLEWNSTILDLLDYSEGSFLQQGGQTTFLAGEITTGKIEGLTCSLLGPVSGVDGNGPLASFQFNATVTGTTSINMTFSDLLDSEGNSLSHDVENGTTKVLPRTLPYVFGKTTSSTWSTNHGDPVPLHPKPFLDRFNITFSLPDENGVMNLTVPKESYDPEPVYDPIGNFTSHSIMTSDGHGQLFTVDGMGDVDMITMTNETGFFFWKNGSWHSPAEPLEERLGDGTPDPAGSSSLYCPTNVSLYQGNGTSGLFLGTFPATLLLTTGNFTNIIDAPTSRLNGSFVNATGVPFLPPFAGTVVTYASGGSLLNVSFLPGVFDGQSRSERTGAPAPAFMATLLSPANLYVTDPENRHIGTHPTTGEYVNEIPGAFYTGPGAEPQRIVIPDPPDGVYDVKIVGTGSGSYTSVVELATTTETTTYTHTGNISVGQILESEANISEGEMTFEGSRDIATTNITPCKTVIGKGFPLGINVTIQNQGYYSETFNVTAYANTTIISTLVNITLTSGNSTTITFTWNTTGVPYGYYTITANATSVPGESETADNTFENGWVVVTGVGDVNGDLVVNVLDVILALVNAGSVPPKPPECDVNCDNTINVLDLILCLVNAGPV